MAFVTTSSLSATTTTSAAAAFHHRTTFPLPTKYKKTGSSSTAVGAASQQAVAFSSISRSYIFSPKVNDKPKLILISGCTGTGKSTFGMSVALDQDILRCISSDTVRAVMRSFISPDISPALHRSSYTPSLDDQSDPVRSWRECCGVLEKSIEGLVDDAITRGVSLVVEGVHVVPGTELIDRWTESGGVAVGCLLTIQDEEAHKALLYRRGEITKKGEQKKIQAFDRVRAIQDEMIRLAKSASWLLIEQKLEPDPLEMVSARLFGNDEAFVNSMGQHDILGGFDVGHGAAENVGLDVDNVSSTVTSSNDDEDEKL